MVGDYDMNLYEYTPSRLASPRSLPSLLVHHRTWYSDISIESTLEVDADTRGTSPSSVRNSTVHAEAAVALHNMP